MLTLWGRKNSINVQKVLWTLAELGLEWERIDAGGAYGRTDEPAFAALNPNRKVPVLVDGPTVLWESNTILRYLAAAYDPGHRLLPADPAARARIEMWMDWQVGTLWTALRPVFIGLVRTPEAERDTAALAAGAAECGALFGLFEGWLEDRDYLGGAAFGLGDVPLGCTAWRYFSLPIERPPLPRVEAWFERLRQRPAFAEQVMQPLS